MAFDTDLATPDCRLALILTFPTVFHKFMVASLALSVEMPPTLYSPAL
jgi:hypothetical protein